MPSTVVNVAVGGLIAAGLLGAAFDRKSVLVVLAAAAAPDLDAVAAVVVDGAHNALLHTVFVPLIAAILVYVDVSARDSLAGRGIFAGRDIFAGRGLLGKTSWLRGRYGWYGVRVAWVAILAYAIAGIGLDLFNVEAANPLYPLHDQFYSIVGKFDITNKRGVVQTYVGVGTGGDGGFLRIGRARGSTGEFTVPTPFTAGSERQFVVVESGWQALLVLTGGAVLGAKFLSRTESPREGSGN